MRLEKFKAHFAFLRMEDSTGNIRNFKPATVNANRHTQRGLKALQDSMRKSGYTEPMVAAADGEMLSGSARLESVADVFGLDVEPIIVESDGTRPIVHVRSDIANAHTPEAQRIAISSNRIAALDLDWDVEALMQMPEEVLTELWTPEELSELGDAWANAHDKPEPPEPQIDKAEELRVKWGVESGQLWQLGEHRLICGDCTDKAVVERVMAGEEAQLVVTSPPYWVGREYENEHGKEDIRTHIERAARVISGTVGDVAHIAINTGMTTENRQGGKVRRVWLLLDWWADAFEDQGWYLRNVRIWSKEGGFSGFAPEQDLASQDWEFLASFTGVKPRPQNRIGERWALDGVWTVQPQTAEVGHSAPFPPEIPGRYVKLYTNNGDCVFDPYCGSGTTICACERLARKCRAVEIAPGYVAVALQRWADMTGKTPELID